MDVSKDIAHQLRETLEPDEGPAAEAGIGLRSMGTRFPLAQFS